MNIVRRSLVCNSTLQQTLYIGPSRNCNQSVLLKWNVFRPLDNYVGNYYFRQYAIFNNINREKC